MKLSIHTNAINYETEKAKLIKIPDSKWQFWLSNKCIFPSADKVTIYLSPEYTYYMAKIGTKIKEEWKGSRIIEMFDGHQFEGYKRRPRVIVSEHEPEHHDKLKEVKVDDELIR